MLLTVLCFEVRYAKLYLALGEGQGKQGIKDLTKPYLPLTENRK